MQAVVCCCSLFLAWSMARENIIDKRNTCFIKKGVYDLKVAGSHREQLQLQKIQEVKTNPPCALGQQERHFEVNSYHQRLWLVKIQIWKKEDWIENAGDELSAFQD